MILKEESEFNKDSQKIDGLYSSCKTCQKSRGRKYHDDNKHKINKKKRDNHDPIKKNEYYEKNKVKIKARTAAYKKKRYHADDSFKIYEVLSGGLRRLLKGTAKKNKALSYLGCTVDEFKEHLESQFQEGMTWDNWDQFGWHLDHILPLASFNLLIEDEIKIACHYTNFQPLWAVDNKKKGAKLPSK
jgi:hypothetical protein